MKTENTDHKFQWLPILLIVLNIFDIVVHLRADPVEALRATSLA